jgi:hypothetical protein
LRFDRKRRILTVYRHKICLINHAKGPQPAIIPLPILEETIDTFNLLFPFGDAASRALLEREKQPFYSLGNCDRNLKLNLSHYVQWGNKLAELCEGFNEPPRYWRQLVSDRRNVMDWATFWIAVLVLLLALVSIAIGIVAMVYTIKQYELALAQACSVSNAPKLLPRFCH